MKKIFLLFALITFVLTTSVITVSACPTIIFSQTNASCNGSCDGEIISSVTGGAPGYTYSWSNGATTPTISNLCASTYILCVTDNNGCVTCDTTIITEPSPIVITGTITNTSCNGVCDGAITTSVTGGAGGPYTYVWSNGATGPTVTGLCAGTITVCVTDANGCTVCQSFTVTEPPQLVITGSVTNISCYGACDGDIIPSVTGGTPPYNYQWFPAGGFGPNYCAGTYTLCVTDANGCMICQNFTVTSPSQITATAAITNASCYGSCDGIIQITGVSGGSGGGYTYLWSPGGVTTPYLQNACAGAYTLCITDSSGCMECINYTISQPAPVIPVINAIGDSVYSSAALTYQWHLNANPVTGATNQGHEAVQPGYYWVTVTDTNGCTGVSDSIYIAPVGAFENEDSFGSFSIFPVPAAEKAFLNFYLSKEQNVSINLYDINGKLIKHIHTGVIQPGSRELIVNTSSLPMGMYILKIEGEINRNLRLVVNR